MGLIKAAIVSGTAYAIAKDYNKKKQGSGNRSLDHSQCHCNGHMQPSDFQYQQQQHFQPPPQQPSSSMGMQQQYHQPQYQPQQYYSHPGNYQQPPPAYQTQPYSQEGQVRAPAQASSKN